MDSVWSGVAGVVLGWFLGETGSVLSRRFERKRVERALLDELGELAESLQSWWMAYARSLQMLSAGRLDNVVQLPLGHAVFEHHYHTAALGMSRDQKRSMQMIHGYIDRLNANTADLRVYLQGILDPSVESVEMTDARDRTLRDKLKSLLSGVRLAQWHIQYHFEHPYLPDLSPGTPAHKIYAKYIDKVRDEISEVERQGTTVPLKRFDQAYVPEYFDRVPDF